MAKIRDIGVLGWIYMMRVSDKLHRLSGEHLTQYDLTDAQFDVLVQLSAEEGISQQALSTRLLVTKGNVCGLIDRMEARNLVQRKADPDDRRSNLLFLTPQGRMLAQRVVPAQEEFISKHMGALSPEEIQTLRTLLRKLDKSIGK